MSSSADVLKITNNNINIGETPTQPSEKKLAPWANIAKSPQSVFSLNDVMSEQLADHLQQKEVKQVLDSSLKEETDKKNSLETEDLAYALELNDKLNEKGAGVVDDSNNNDHILAQLLQLEFDKEYDETLKQREKQRNKHSRVAVSYDKFKSVHPAIAKDEQHFDLLTQKELSSETESEDEICSIKFKNGIHGKGENMISKHDKELTGRHNAQKVMNFPPEFETGDSHGINMCLSNQVFNTLKLHSLSEQKRSNRTADKQDRSTNEMSLDKKTRLILFKLVNVSILNSIGGIISTGKEATVFYAAGGDTNDLLVPKECVAKVFKTTLNEFKTREKYIADDYRFKDRFKHLNPQKIIKLWAEKEMHNLMKMRKNDIPCPDPVLLKKHVLIMSFIGSDSVPAPKLKDAILNKDELKSAYEQSVKILKDLYTCCNLVHADFNQFNLLWFQNSVWVIDVSQSVEPIHPMGLEFLLRDCTNIIKFFSSRMDEQLKSGEELFNEITGMNFKGQGELFLSQIQKYTKDKLAELKIDNNKEDEKYNFDYHFEKSLRDKTRKGESSPSSDDESSSDD